MLSPRSSKIIIILLFVFSCGGSTAWSQVAPRPIPQIQPPAAIAPPPPPPSVAPAPEPPLPSVTGPVAGKADNQISGKVMVASGKVARGAIVTLRDAVTGEKRTAKADKQGKYLFDSVYQGDYSLSASFKDKKSAAQKISLGYGEKLQKDLKVKND